MAYLKRSLIFSMFVFLACSESFGRNTLQVELLGKITDCQGVAALRPLVQERWTPLATGVLVDSGDLIRCEKRGANAVRLRFNEGGGAIIGPGSLVELTRPGVLKIIRGEVEVESAAKKSLMVELPGNKQEQVLGRAIFQVKEPSYGKLEDEPPWLKYFKGTIGREPMGSLLANVEGRNLPLTPGYHKVTVDIRDQIARTIVEESFVNNTSGTLEGIFHFPLPQDASISGFGMWIGDELVEADVVEKQRAREIYETILRERRDPGLLEWSGGNIFKARVFPIFAHSEKRIKITYTQVLPMENGVYRYSYALQSEMLKQFPLRELELKVSIHSEQPLEMVLCPTHETRLTQTKNSAQVEFSAQEYTPSRDFEVLVETDKAPEVVVIPHQRGDDGYFLLQVAQPHAGQAGGRKLINDGPPLDLVVMADTSASMDSEQRGRQEEFIAFLMGSLGSRDCLQVAAVDMDCHWISGDDPEAVRDFLSHRASLGLTDLERVFGEVFDKCGAGTHIIYLGDCVDTTRGADPVDTVRRLTTLYKAKGKGRIHTVAIGNSFESGVMKALANVSGGSTRRLQGDTPARAGVMELLEELTSPGITEMKVEFSGVRVARVYPEELPNLAAGKQQIILGRYLPDGGQQSGKVTVTGTYKGKAVSYQAPFVVKDGEAGNSFIPRLWARLHLDALLEQGGTQEIKDEVIALSEEYHIMTPYTSFLVLESDADRERFKVARRFNMRDGEKFFAEGRDKANYELRQRYMRLAGKWRQDLRRDMLSELLDLGREYYNIATPYPQGEALGLDGGGWSYGGRERFRDKQMSFAAGSIRSSLRAGDSSIASEDYYGRVADAEGGGDVDEFFDLDAPGDMMDDAPYPELMIEALEKEELVSMEQRDSDAANMDMRRADSGQYKAIQKPRSSRLNSNDRGSGFAADMNTSGVFDQLHTVKSPIIMRGIYGNREVGNRAQKHSIHGGYQAQPHWHNWIDQLFPQVADPYVEPVITPPPEVKEWPESAKKLAASLLRQPVLDQLAGALEIGFEATTYGAGEVVTGKSTQKLFYSPAEWVSWSWHSSDRSLVEWSDGEHRAAYAPCFKLGRQRKAVESDTQLAFSNFSSFNDFSLTSLEKTYRAYIPSVTDEGQGRVLLTLSNPDLNSDQRMEYLIDSERNVVVEARSFSQGAFTSTMVFHNFAKAGGCWWAQLVESRNKDGVVVNRTDLSIKEIAGDEFKRQAAALRPNNKDAIIIDQLLPDYEAARQAKLDQKMELGHYLAHISFYSQTQQWEKAREVWAEAAKLVQGRTGESWINLAVDLQSRRHEEARQIVNKKAGRLVKKKGIDEIYIGNTLFSYLQKFAGVNEWIDLLEIMRPVYERQGKYLKSDVAWKRNYAQALSQAGRGVEALAIWKELNQAFPTDTAVVSLYIRTMLQDGRMEEAYAWLMERLVREGLWSDQERESIRSSVTHQFENRIDSDKWLAFLKGWIDDNTVNQHAYQKYLEALYRNHRAEEAHRLIEKWSRAGVAFLHEEAQQDRKQPAYDTEEWKTRQRLVLRMQAAVQHILGQSYGYINHLDSRWHNLLAQLVRGCYRVDSSRYIAVQIMGHPLFKNIEEAAALRQELKQLLVGEFDDLSPQLVGQLVGWLDTNDPKVEREEWAAVAVRIQARWDDPEQTDQERNVLSSALVRVLNHAGNLDGVTRFLRKQWQTGPEIYRQHSLSQFYNNLLAQEWAEEIESELFGLIKEFAGKDESPQARLTEAVPVLMATVDAMLAARQEASLEQVAGKDGLSRIEYMKLVKAHEQMAREGMVKRLEGEVERQAAELEPWVKIERLYLQLKLGHDAKLIAAECWKLLPSEPPACQVESKDKSGGQPPPEPYPVVTPRATIGGNKIADNGKELSLLDAGLIDRCVTTLAALAAKPSADKTLGDKLSAYMDLGIKRNPDIAYWRYQKYRLLVARNAPKQLEESLKSWITPDQADDTWRLALGYLMAEMNRVEEAVALFEQIEKSDGLGRKEYAIMAGWYMLLDQMEKHKAAELKELMVIDENQLASRLNMILKPWQRGDGKVPAELDPAAIKIFTALLKKAQHPQNYVARLHDFYRYTKDFRLLECMSEGVIGHTAAQVYPYVGSLSALLSDVREEATVDSAMAYLAKMRLQAETRVDERALDILEMLMRRRAAEVQNQPGAHIEPALAAMQRAFKGEWQRGERRLMADLLRGLGRMSSEKLKSEQLRELKALFECRSEPDQERLHIALQHAVIVYDYGQQDQAVDLLEAGLAEYREKSGGRLPASANSSLDQFISYLKSMGRFARAESYLERELKQPENQQQMYWLIQRKLRMYNAAINSSAAVALGSGQELYERVLDLYISELDRSDQNHRNQMISLVSDFFKLAKKAKLDVTRMKNFAFVEFPKFIAKESNHHSYQDHVSALSSSLHDVLGARVTLEFLIVMIETQPEWLRFTHYSGWSLYAYQLSRFRHEAGEIGELAARLLEIVKAEIRRDLECRNQRNRSMYNKHSSYFWNEKADDFMAVAEEVWREHKNSGATTLYISDYMWNGLEKRARAAEVLMQAYNSDLLDESGQARLVNRLHYLKKFEEPVPILEGLIGINENQVMYRMQLMSTCFHTGRAAMQREVLVTADRYFHQPGKWSEGVVYQLAKGCLNVKYYKEAVEYYLELIPMHKRGHPQRGVGSAQLSMYYRELSETYTALRMTAEAVDAASGAVITWGRSNRNRADALRALEGVVQNAPDLDQYVDKIEQDASESGVENPILRKAVGKAFLSKKNYEAAIRHLKVAVEAQPHDSETHQALVDAYDRMGDKAGATAQLLEAVKLSRRDINLYKSLGERYALQLKNKVESERAYTSIVEMLPNDSESHTMLAEIRQGQGRWKEAMHHWRQVIRVRSLEPTGYIKLAEAQVHERQFDDALETIKILESKSWPARFSSVESQTRDLRRRIRIPLD
ncbi:MAG: VIT domain-containing protein [Kiritimatiellae bacterium]|nr:VIT domain-containing protein [Kiritimatiellia bacterium]